MATLTNTKIKDTYDGLLKTTDNDVLDVSGVTLIEDGLGNASALSLGRAGNGVTITGSFRIYNEDDDSNVRIIAGDNDSSIYSDRLLNIYTSSNDAITFSTNGESQIRMTIAANGNVSIEEDLTITGALIASSLNYPTTDGTNGQALATDGAGNLSFIDVTVTTPNLQEVTDVSPASTTNAITVGGLSTTGNVTANSFIKAAGLSSQFLKADGSVDSNAYLTSESDTLDSVTGRNATTSNSITVGGITAASLAYPSADGTNGQAIVTDGAGNLSFATVTGTTPTLDQVTGAGETSSRDIVVNGLTIGRGNNNDSSNTALGLNSLQSITAFNCTAVGAVALGANTSGGNNTAVGNAALLDNTTGSNNTALGLSSLENNLSGSQNIAIGVDAGDSITSGSNNVYVGYNADASASNVSNEIVIGANATGNGSNSATYGDSNITKHIFTSGNVGIGTSSITDSRLQIKGGSNVTTAYYDGLKVTSNNETIYTQYNWNGINGNSTLLFATADTEAMRITSGGEVLIGTQTAQSGAQGGGANILTLKSAGNNWGVGPSTSFGNFYVVNSSNVGVYLTSGATSWISLSDERQKDIIENIENAIDKISNWRTVVGKYKNDSEETRRSFLIAQDVLDTFPEAVDTSLEENYGLRYSDTIPVLVKAIQEQQEIINDLKSRIETLENN